MRFAILTGLPALTWLSILHLADGRAIPREINQGSNLAVTSLFNITTTDVSISIPDGSLLPHNHRLEKRGRACFIGCFRPSGQNSNSPSPDLSRPQDAPSNVEPLDLNAPNTDGPTFGDPNDATERNGWTNAQVDAMRASGATRNQEYAAKLRELKQTNADDTGNKKGAKEMFHKDTDVEKVNEELGGRVYDAYRKPGEKWRTIQYAWEDSRPADDPKHQLNTLALWVNTSPKRGQLQVMGSWNANVKKKKQSSGSTDPDWQWSDQVMAAWRQTTSMSQRKKLNHIFRDTIRDEDQKANPNGDLPDIKLNTVKAMDRAFEAMGKPKDQPLLLRADQPAGREKDAYDLVSRQVHVDRVQKLLLDHRKELDNKQIESVELFLDHGRWGDGGKAARFIIIKLKTV